jgi:hypothetical protein
MIGRGSRSGFRQEKIMAFVLTQRVSMFHGRTKLLSGRHLAERFRRRLNLTPQERANLYVSRMPIAVITASLGGHPTGMDMDR